MGQCLPHSSTHAHTNGPGRLLAWRPSPRWVVGDPVHGRRPCSATPNKAGRFGLAAALPSPKARDFEGMTAELFLSRGGGGGGGRVGRGTSTFSLLGNAMACVPPGCALRPEVRFSRAQEAEEGATKEAAHSRHEEHTRATGMAAHQAGGCAGREWDDVVGKGKPKRSLRMDGVARGALPRGGSKATPHQKSQHRATQKQAARTAPLCSCSLEFLSLIGVRVWTDSYVKASTKAKAKTKSKREWGEGCFGWGGRI